MALVWYTIYPEINEKPKEVLISINGSYDENRISINIDIEHLSKDGKFTISLYDKATGDPGRHPEDYLRDHYLFRLQKESDKIPKQWVLFRAWAVGKIHDLDYFLPSTPLETP